MVLRDLGLRRQSQLWESWGGAPSTRFARATDTWFDSRHKDRIRASVRRRFGIQLFGAEEEANNLIAADRSIEQAFRRVREFLRQRDDVGLVDKQNAEYGFARNLYAGREAALIFSLLGMVVCGFAHSASNWTFNAGSQLNLLVFVLWLWLGWFVLPDLVKRNAENYAERAWMTFLEIEERL